MTTNMTVNFLCTLLALEGFEVVEGAVVVVVVVTGLVVDHAVVDNVTEVSVTVAVRVVSIVVVGGSAGMGEMVMISVEDMFGRLN